MQRQRDVSEQTAIRIDREIKRIVSQQYDYAIKLLDDNRDAMERLAQALLEMESLNNEEILAAIDGSTIEEIQALRAQRKQEEADRVELANSEPSEPAEIDDTPRSIPSIVPLKPGGEET
jgi:cell division protease FtsH